MKRFNNLLLPILAAIGFLVMSSVYVVDEREKALRLWFGEVTAVINDPGLNFKVPFLHEVVKYEDRILPLDVQPDEFTPLDDRRLVVDGFALWRIQDPVQFRRAVGSGGQRSATQKLDGIMNDGMRSVLGRVTSNEILSTDRTALMAEIRDAVREQATVLGVEIVDVRIKRADLPEQNLEATFGRMRAEREREAADEIARGNEAAQRVRASADRTVVETTSVAQKDADIIRGQADGKRNAIFAEAFGRDPEFFAFYRSLTAYEKSLNGDNATMIISPNSEFFDYLNSDSLNE